MFDPYKQGEPIPDEVIQFVIIFYSAVLLIVLSICGCCTYFCIKKNK